MKPIDVNPLSRIIKHYQVWDMWRQVVMEPPIKNALVFLGLRRPPTYDLACRLYDSSEMMAKELLALSTALSEAAYKAGESLKKFSALKECERRRENAADL